MPFWNRKTDTRLVVGLGNPGGKYAGSRHNIGFLCLDNYVQSHHLAFAKSRHKALVTEAKTGNYDVILAKPQTFMNLSGEAVGRLFRQHKVKSENMIVVHDDLDLPVGRIRIRLGGSSGGHKGINSIVEHISSQEFVHIRVGIGRPNNGSEEDIINYVLGDFTPEEKAVIKNIIPLVGEALDSILVNGLTATMNKYNGTDLRK